MNEREVTSRTSFFFRLQLFHDVAFFIINFIFRCFLLFLCLLPSRSSVVDVIVVINFRREQFIVFVSLQRSDVTTYDLTKIDVIKN